MKKVVWSKHAEDNLSEREIDRAEVENTIQSAQLKTHGHGNRLVLMKVYFDGVLNQEMLIRVIVEEINNETVVVTVYKTSKVKRYIKEL